MNKITIKYTFYVLKYVYYLYLKHSKTRPPLYFSILGQRRARAELGAEQLVLPRLLRRGLLGSLGLHRELRLRRRRRHQGGGGLGRVTWTRPPGTRDPSIAVLRLPCPVSLPPAPCVVLKDRLKTGVLTLALVRMERAHTQETKYPGFPEENARIPKKGIPGKGNHGLGDWDFSIRSWGETQSTCIRVSGLGDWDYAGLRPRHERGAGAGRATCCFTGILFPGYALFPSARVLP